MYCIHCGVKLADTEKKCPLCETVVCHPQCKPSRERPLYPPDKRPQSPAGAKALNGALVILFLIPLMICFASDFQINGRLDWFGYVAGALLMAYVMFALPLWFKKPNPVIFVPCNFVAITLYLLYIAFVTGGHWFMCFAFPVAGTLCLIVCSAVTLLYYLRKGKLYVLGGATMALGAFMPLLEFLLKVSFQLPFVGWSIYPMVSLVMLGGLLIYFAINSSAREIIHRKLFF